MLKVILVLSILCLLHTYLFYPILVWFLAIFKKGNQDCYQVTDELPAVTILMAAYNEELVIREKIESVFNTNFPHDKIQFLIGSDNSSDSTNTIITELQQKYPQIKFYDFKERNGKVGILNKMMQDSTNEILIPTDANVLFKSNTIYELVKHFKNNEIGVVAANIINKGLKKDGISHQEKSYIQQENYIKFYEGKLWGTTMGAFGACYAIRKEYFPIIPSHILMEDFYITLYAISKGSKAITNLDAVCLEDVSNKIKEEFKRKVRISAGNFQNLGIYKGVLLNPFSGLGFSFWSHKVLRWYGPFFMILAYLTSAILFKEAMFFRALFYAANTILLMSLLDILLQRIKIHTPFRYFTHFIAMNLALLKGFYTYIKGVKKSVWQPTERNLS